MKAGLKAPDNQETWKEPQLLTNIAYSKLALEAPQPNKKYI